MTKSYEDIHWDPQPRRMPTSEECQTNAQIPLTDPHRPTQRGYACWYPQMGGYGGKCVVVLDEPQNGADHACFEAFVWHNGQFPFEDEDRWGDATSPAQLHHCDAQQFVKFGNLIQQLAEQKP